MKKSILFIMILMFVSCNKAKETINKSGEVVGKSATEFFGGVAEGVDKSLECELILSDEIKDKISTGKFYIESDDSGGKDNKLVVYFIFNEDVNQDITFRITDKKELEYGRSKINVTGKKGEAAYFDVVFDKRTIIESKTKIHIN